MKPGSSLLVMLACGILLGVSSVLAQDVAVVAPASDAAEGLDLQAVAGLFKDAENLEAFEKSLNDPEIGVNNLDLDDNGEVDFVRVVEEAEDETRVIILQAALGENEFQDVATIEVEKSGAESYNMQVHGNEAIYGVDYYVAPVQVQIHAWPIVGWLYLPHHRPYYSVYHFHHHPHWWRPWRPVHVNVYRTRTVRIKTTTTFSVVKTSRVKTVRKVNYRPSSSTLVKKQTRVTRTRGGSLKQTGHVKRTTTQAGGKKTTVHKAGRRTVNPRTGESTTVKAGKKTVTNRKTGKRTTVKGVKRTKKTKGGKSTTKVRGKKTKR